jgi:hypothetical protein
VTFSNGDALITDLPTRPCALPLCQCSLFYPQSQAAKPPESRFICWPVLHLELHLRNVMAAVGVVLVWHRNDSANMASHGNICPFPDLKCTNAQ